MFSLHPLRSATDPKYNWDMLRASVNQALTVSGIGNVFNKNKKDERRKMFCCQTVKRKRMID